LLLALLAFILAMIRVSPVNKFKLLIAALGVCIFAVLSLSHQALDRYLTLFASDMNGVAAQSAEASSQMRHQKLMESIELTLAHPIVGVGMGVFMPASVEVAKSNGARVDWEVSHNSYTQVSSELGIPGLFILLAIYVIAWTHLTRFDKAAKRLDREDLRQTVFTLRVALIILCIHFCFDSMAYLFYMPLVIGLITAFALAYQPVLSESQEQGGADASPLHAGVPTQVPPKAEKTRLTPITPRNPYRFGRRR
jgi:O-antigen ligase